jgi:hypothetical protein
MRIPFEEHAAPLCRWENFVVGRSGKSGIKFGVGSLAGLGWSKEMRDRVNALPPNLPTARVAFSIALLSLPYTY